MTPVFGMIIANCGKKLLPISEHFSDSLSSMNLRTVSYQWFTSHRGQCHWSLYFVSPNFRLLLDDFPFNFITTIESNKLGFAARKKILCIISHLSSNYYTTKSANNERK